MFAARPPSGERVRVRAPAHVAVTPILVGVLNVTPDSFSDGGSTPSVDAAVDAGVRMVDEGAAWIDVGGESTRPGAAVVPEAEEIAPGGAGHPRAARTAGAAGAHLDRHLQGRHGAGGAGGGRDGRQRHLGRPAGSRTSWRPRRTRGRRSCSATCGGAGDDDGRRRLRGRGPRGRRRAAERLEAARAAGCTDIWVDPGIGFGKRTAARTWRCWRGLPELCARWGVPVMVGVSRKRFLGELTGRPPEATRVRDGGRGGGGGAGRAPPPCGSTTLRRCRDVVRVAAAIAAAKAGS